ncbi:hypothetical protein [Streptomyces sp. NBC_00391]|uniref:hypothetical protein n=1 Tax=Streptomyces sp. NBC_00391 TaxID=2903647 RepID=UPI002E1D35B9
MGELRSIAASFVVSGPSGVAVRTRLKQLTPGDEKVLRLVGAHLGSLAAALSLSAIAILSSRTVIVAFLPGRPSIEDGRAVQRYAR